ncbi:MAG TPA: stalk domain-containing protein [Caldisericia bacterium]|nr:stalk domain-containing protein [Caldisericia bacterium]HPF48686.1 stalk domain-containing protein [Caldisericia bacterium]HPI83654.1 stalk domain-containing protein [Caldisericia bacterium]HPQ93141.1 stalk domain-containing protein [Caldisericia bacterium]HRV75026.1 stalk domain-containing protein [Caldisericia bacterium]
MDSDRFVLQTAFKDINAKYTDLRIVRSSDDILFCRYKSVDGFRFICYDNESNKILWDIDLDIKRMYEEVTIFDSYLYYLTDKKIVCQNIISGQIIWSSTLPNSHDSHSSFYVLCEKGLFLGFRDNSVYQYNIENGEILWQKDIIIPDNMESDRGRPGLAYIDNKLIFYNYGLYCLSPENGSIIWQNTDSKNEPLRCYSPYGLYATDKVIIVLRDFEFGIVGINANDGRIIWETNIANFCNIRFRTIHQNKLVGLSTIDITNGSEIWKDKLHIYDGQAVSIGNKIAVSESGRLDIIDPSTGNTIWRYKDITCMILVLSGSPYIETEDGCFYQLSPAADSLTFKIASNQLTLDNDKSEQMDTSPIIKDGRTLLPARYVTEPLGGQVEWDADERKVTCTLVAPDNPETDDYKENVVELWIGKPTAKINGIETQIDPNNPEVVPTIIDGRTMVPMRFLAESLGCEVEWIAETKEIVLTYAK